MAGRLGRAVKPAIVLLTALVTAGHDTIAVVAPAFVAATLDDLAAVLAADGGAIRRRSPTSAPIPTRSSRRPVRLLSGHQEARDWSPRTCLGRCWGIRDRAVFEHAVLGLEPLVTKHDLGTNLASGTNGCASRTRSTARASHAATSCRPLVDLAAELARTVGAAAPLAAVDQALTPSACRRCRTRALPAAPARRSYRAIEGHLGWAATVPAEPVGETWRLLSDDGGVNLLTDVTWALMALGVADAHVLAWLDRQRVGLIDGPSCCGRVTRRRSPTCAARYGPADGVRRAAGWLPAGGRRAGGRTAASCHGRRRGGPVEWAATPPPAALGCSGRRRASSWTTTSDRRSRAVGSRGRRRPRVAARCRPPLHSILRRCRDRRPRDAARGSLRPIALAVGAALGDEFAISST